MITIGDKNEFAISFEYHSEAFSDDPIYVENKDYYCEWIKAELWVKNRNLFAFKNNNYDATFAHNFSTLLHFYSDFLYYHLIDDPFPIACQADIAVDMYEETSLIHGEAANKLQNWFDLDWDNIDMNIQNIRDEWFKHHCYCVYDDGSFLPFMFFRKIADKIEVSWENNGPKKINDESTYCFIHQKGVEFVDIKLYKEVIISFCEHLCNKFESLYPKLIADCRKNLQKAIDVAV